VPIVAGEEPTPFQRICPLADCLNGISFNTWLDAVWFVNADLTVSLHRDPVGEWFCARAVSHWEPTGIGLAEAALFDVEGHVGAASQNLLLSPPGG
jgi:Acyl-CoA thioesterase C-terminal domain